MTNQEIEAGLQSGRFVELDESYTQPKNDSEQIVNKICWHGATVTEAARLMGCSEKHVLDTIAREFRFVLGKLLAAHARAADKD
jgi:hypothetical protein